ncbi:response regulator [Nitrincola tapanii]|uniref:Response regulator n=1 Tax=Nitrincola tapanii TaxID=1708751 RepID=A0A5A9VZC6_9GAMM|nr:response regulator [Nitrincola tapanii]KAA0873584.1 response regulator [Nitrincola tapanii]
MPNFETAYHILLVEDERTTNTLLSRFFRDRGISCTSVFSLQEAEQVLKTPQDFSLVILDNQLSDGVGFDLLPVLSFHAPRVPVMILTASDDQILMRDYFHAGVTDYLIKPANLDLLLIKCRRLMDAYLHQQRMLKPQVSADASNSPCVLLVEDDLDAAELVRFQLLEEDSRAYEVVLAHSLADVKHLLQAVYLVPEIILCDLNLPDSSGVATVLKIRQLLPEIPLVVLTGLEDKSIGVQAINAGADDYLTKGVDSDVLNRTLQYSLLRGARAAGQRFARAVFAHAHEGILVTNLEGVILDANPAFSLITGYERSEVLGKTPRVLSSGLQPENFYKEMWQTLSVKGFWQGEVLNKHKSGRIYSESLTIVSIKNDQGQKVNYVAFLTDISELKKQKTLLAEKNQMLETLLDERDQEEQIARNVYEHIAISWQKHLPYLTCLYQPAGSFSGDLVLWHEAEDGSFYLASLDATGHGLAAAITLMPITEVFSVMVKKSCSLKELVAELNRKVGKLLPMDRFVTGVLLKIDAKNHLFEVWNGGHPEVLLLDALGRSVNSLRSRNMALGILDDDQLAPEILVGSIEGVHSLLLMSDGILDQTNSAGKSFGQSEVRKAIRLAEDPDFFAQSIMNAYHQFSAQMPRQDDATLCQINLALWRKQLIFPTMHSKGIGI